jgi:hypothetical protein
MGLWHNEAMKNLAFLFITLIFALYIPSLSANRLPSSGPMVHYKSDKKPDEVMINGKPLFLELGDKIMSFYVFDKSGASEYRLFLQTESSVTIMDEGPHLDLTNWKHGQSEEIQLSEKEGEYFYKDQSSQMSFPEVSLSELIDAAKKKGGERWAQLAKKCNTPKEYPCSVTPSKYILRLERKVNGAWIKKGKAIIIPPMGC